MTAPCKNCPYRAIGCHSCCGPYQQYKAEQAKASERRKNEMEAVDAIIKGNMRRTKSTKQGARK